VQLNATVNHMLTILLKPTPLRSQTTYYVFFRIRNFRHMRLSNSFEITQIIDTTIELGTIAIKHYEKLF
jgi:hypothetical protein